MRKEELKSVERLRKEIDLREELLANLRGMQCFLTSKISAIPSSKKINSQVEDLVIRTHELREQIDKLDLELREAQKFLSEKILDEVDDAALQRMLMLKFVECLSFRKVAKLMNYSLRQTFKKIGDYVNALNA